MIKDEINKLLLQKPFDDLYINASLWAKTFGIRSFITSSDVAIPILPLSKRDSKILRIVDKIEFLIRSKAHKKIKSTILQDVVQSKNLNTLVEELDGAKFLYGVTILSTCEGIEFIYKSLVMPDFSTFERITVEDEDILDLVIDSKLCKVKRNLLLPVDKIFTSKFFKYLKDVVRGKYDEIDNPEDTRSQRR